MARPELGTKRECPSCSSKFYDLNRDPIVCPKCGETFTANMVSPPMRPTRAQAASPAKSGAPVAEEFEDEEEEGEAEEEEDIISLADVDDTLGEEDVEDDEDEEAVAVADDTDIPDLDGGDEIEADDDDEEDVFLEDDEEEDDPVTDIIGGGPGGDEDDR